MTRWARKHWWFQVQQNEVCGWADRVHLNAFEAEEQTQLLAGIFGMRPPVLLWEVDGLLTSKAATIRNERTGVRTIAFESLGCTLLTLCHELVHCWSPWDEPHHEESDWDLCVILLEETRAAVG